MQSENTSNKYHDDTTHKNTPYTGSNDHLGAITTHRSKYTSILSPPIGHWKRGAIPNWYQKAIIITVIRMRYVRYVYFPDCVLKRLLIFAATITTKDYNWHNVHYIQQYTIVPSFSHFSPKNPGWHIHVPCSHTKSPWLLHGSSKNK